MLAKSDVMDQLSQSFKKKVFVNLKHTLSPSVVRIDKAFGTSKAVFCFFTIWMLETGITTCGRTEDVRKRVPRVLIPEHSSE